MYFSQLVFVVVLVLVATFFDFTDIFLPKDLTEQLYSDSVEEKDSKALNDLEEAYNKKEASASKDANIEKEASTSKKETSETVFTEAVDQSPSTDTPSDSQETETIKPPINRSYDAQKQSTSMTSKDLKSLVSSISKRIYEDGGDTK